jgi:hypothetical protein
LAAACRDAARQFLSLGFQNIADRDGGAFRCEQSSLFGPLASAAPCDERHLIVELEHFLKS